MRKRIPRIRRWEYVHCVLDTAHKNGDLDDLEKCLIDMKYEFERQKSIAIGRGSPRKKGLAKVGELMRDSVTLATHLELIEDGEALKLTKMGEKVANLEIASSEYLCLILPHLVAQYNPIFALLDTLYTIPKKEIRVPELRDIKEFHKYSETQGLYIGQTDYMIARDLLGQLGVVNWLLYEEDGKRFSRVYLTSDFFEVKPSQLEEEAVICVVAKEKEFWISRRRISLMEFIPVLWDEYIELAKGISLRPVFYSHLRDAVCYLLRIGDHVFDIFMKELLADQDIENFSIFGSGGSIPYSKHSSSVLKSLPLKFTSGRYIVYIKMEEC